MPARPFDGLLIDFYGTIAAGDREAVEAACRHIVHACEIPVAPPHFAVLWGERYFATVARSNHDAFRTLYECEVASLRETLADFGQYPDPAHFLTDLQEYWHNPPVHADALEFLRGVELPIGCVSNADSKPLRAAIGRHGLCFDAVVSSEAVRCYKPDPVIFQHALRALGLQADRVLHIGDSLHSDVAGAAGVGMAVTWIRRKDRIHDIGLVSPSFTVSDLRELKAILGGTERPLGERARDAVG